MIDLILQIYGENIVNNVFMMFQYSSNVFHNYTLFQKMRYFMSSVSIMIAKEKLSLYEERQYYA